MLRREINYKSHATLIFSMEFKKLQPNDYAQHGLGLLKETPEPPEGLWYEGILPPPNLSLLAIVGSRKYTSYGKQVIEHLVSGLADYPIGIVSGLALGIDGLAHEAAMRHGLYTLAVPGSGLDRSVLYPSSHKALAERILENGGGLLSELPPLTGSAPWTFPKRNRIIAGLCKATLLIEAGAKSGTLITARLTVDYNRELLAVPGSIFSENSYGTHQFIKLGATVVTEAADILDALNLAHEPKTIPLPSLTDDEAKVISLLHEPLERDVLLRALALPVSEANILLMQMEMAGLIGYHSPLYRRLK